MHQSFQGPQNMLINNHENINNNSQTNTHIINQSLKPKMIVNNNSIPLQPGKMGGMHNVGNFQQHQAHAGDIVQMGSSNPRPASSKVVKKKSTIGSSGNGIPVHQGSIGSKTQLGNQMMGGQ